MNLKPTVQQSKDQPVIDLYTGLLQTKVTRPGQSEFKLISYSC